ncbi:MAG: D-tyrosyl-tRNA(Tyr) deacylase [Chitinophagaceae bacterium]|nr:MAG: D-tyrosyl-tRNA(Tyr) deacylase [Chitinophagaceae bacterium]
MRVVIQRVKHASVTIEGKVFSSVAAGLLVLVGVEEADTTEDTEWLCSKITGLRVFDDEAGVMNLSVKETGGEVLLVSQFTLHAAVKKGNRPSYIRAARPETAIPRYNEMIRLLSAALGKPVATGSFGADMQVELLNDGPVTIWMDSKNRE